MSYSYYAEADREDHYLFTAGFRQGPCWCAACEWAAELDYQIEEASRSFDEAAAADIEAAAADMFDRAEQDRAAEFAPDPWAGLPDPPF